MKFLVTAGPTREPIDPVRFISNRSTGKMGYAVAGAAQGRGHETRLISGPVSLEAPAGVDVIGVVTAAEMLMAVREGVEWCDVLVMVAAVADWRPRECAAQKLKKSTMTPFLELEPTDDILTCVKDLKGNRIYVGFAAETEDVESEARRKLQAKGLDMMVVNDVSRPDAGFALDTNVVSILVRGGDLEVLPEMTKRELGAAIVARSEDLKARRG